MPTKLSSSESFSVVASKEQICSELQGEVVILDIKTGAYYGLNEVGASIWNYIQSPKTVEEIQEAILAEYEIEAEVCKRDISALLKDLAAKGLIEIKNDTPA
ncbi:lasso peptide biosynthesis PqqD family chaperone [Fortiea sp. LEGE XX443]|uniref:lasso peptide biosynthesis PqqD family chaperone n=1 Tax=Fortiea sp. LEGE XX443 TaxID=1828611 RepID=UPI00187EDF21|nr:lasso peptide biosynthesis PqqD family chaperone [Fortiea sp. LEGE XX443]MBE9005961.1 lasso peptide biosynthesis PqqD family chaperone [Fortiea sp. LEGE XX443]